VVLLGTPYTPRGDVDFLTDLTERLGPDHYQAFFQEPGLAEPILEADVRATVIGSLIAVSGDADQVHTTADIDPTSAIPDGDGMLPEWLSEQDVDFLTAEFTRTGYGTALNWYRNHRANWELMAAWHNAPVRCPSLYIGGDKDPVLNWPGFKQLVEDLGRTSLPGLTANIVLEGCGHWVPQERPADVNAHILSFLAGLKG
jgi:pimeloyl-ACP methyl ester carboxylesterase